MSNVPAKDEAFQYHVKGPSSPIVRIRGWTRERLHDAPQQTVAARRLEWSYRPKEIIETIQDFVPFVALQGVSRSVERASPGC